MAGNYALFSSTYLTQATLSGPKDQLIGAIGENGGGLLDQLKKAGKWIIGFHITGSPLSANTGVGLAGIDADRTDLGHSPDAAVLFLGPFDNGNVYVAGTHVIDVNFPTNLPFGTLILLFIDINNKKLWISFGGAGYNSDGCWNSFWDGDPVTDAHPLVALLGAHTKLTVTIGPGATDRITIRTSDRKSAPAGSTLVGGTFDPSGLPAGCVLSNGNLTVTGTAPSGQIAIFGTTDINVGTLWYFEADVLFTSASSAVGFQDAAGNALVANLQGIIFYGALGGSTFHLRTSIPTGVQFTVACCFNFATGHGWIKFIGGDPDNGLDGIDISAVINAEINISPAGSVANTDSVYLDNNGGLSPPDVVTYTSGWAEFSDLYLACLT